MFYFTGEIEALVQAYLNTYVPQNLNEHNGKKTDNKIGYNSYTNIF